MRRPRWLACTLLNDALKGSRLNNWKQPEIFKASPEDRLLTAVYTCCMNWAPLNVHRFRSKSDVPPRDDLSSWRNKQRQTQQREQTRNEKTNSLAALAGRSAESLGTTTSCDGYWRNVWLTFMHVTSPLNLTPACPDREKQTKEQHKQTRKTRQTTWSTFPGTFLLNWTYALCN